MLLLRVAKKKSMYEWVLIGIWKKLVWSTRTGRTVPIWILAIIFTQTCSSYYWHTNIWCPFKLMTRPSVQEELDLESREERLMPGWMWSVGSAQCLQGSEGGEHNVSTQSSSLSPLSPRGDYIHIYPHISTYIYIRISMNIYTRIYVYIHTYGAFVCRFYIFLHIFSTRL